MLWQMQKLTNDLIPVLSKERDVYKKYARYRVRQSGLYEVDQPANPL